MRRLKRLYIPRKTCFSVTEVEFCLCNECNCFYCLIFAPAAGYEKIFEAILLSEDCHLGGVL